MHTQIRVRYESELKWQNADTTGSNDKRVMTKQVIFNEKTIRKWLSGDATNVVLSIPIIHVKVLLKGAFADNKNACSVPRLSTH